MGSAKTTHSLRRLVMKTYPDSLLEIFSVRHFVLTQVEVGFLTLTPVGSELIFNHTYYLHKIDAIDCPTF